MNIDADSPVVAATTSSKVRRLLIAAALYFCVVFFIGAVLGPLRVLWLEPFAGQTLAVLIEAPLLIMAMRFSARWAPAWAGFNGSWAAYLVMGLAALLLQQVADLAVGFGLRDMTFESQLHYFTTPPGWIYVGCLVAFALMPVVRNWGRRAR